MSEAGKGTTTEGTATRSVLMARSGRTVATSTYRAGPELRRVHRLRVTVVVLLCVITVGTGGYWLLGFTPLDAAYQTVTTITTVGFREVEPLSPVGQVFTMALIVTGVGSALYTFGVTFEMLLEGELNQARRRRRMVRHIEHLRDHVLICGWGRVGKAIADHMKAQGETVVVIDNDPARLEGIGHLYVVGDATDDHVLVEAGVGRAKALIAAINTDASNLYITLSGRSLRPELFIIARARDASSDAKLQRAGANRVVNPQAIGGARMAAFVSQPHVAEFLDVVMHEGQVEFRLGEVTVSAHSPLAGLKLADAGIRERTGALILAVRTFNGEFLSNPPVSTTIEPGQVLIAIGTPSELERLTTLNGG